MEPPRSPIYYYGLCILDALDMETQRTMKGTPHMKAVLKSSTYRMMHDNENIPGYDCLVDAYFGLGEAEKLWSCVTTLYEVSKTHLRERATNGPFTYDPVDFDNVIRMNE